MHSGRNSASMRAGQTRHARGDPYAPPRWATSDGYRVVEPAVADETGGTPMAARAVALPPRLDGRTFS
jgi:hypothetical protein